MIAWQIGEEVEKLKTKLDDIELRLVAQGVRISRANERLEAITDRLLKILGGDENDNND